MRGAGAQRARHRVTGRGRSRSPGNGGKLPPPRARPGPAAPPLAQLATKIQSCRLHGPPPRAPHCRGSGGPGKEDWLEDGGPSLWRAPCRRREGVAGRRAPRGGSPGT